MFDNYVVAIALKADYKFKVRLFTPVDSGLEYDTKVVGENPNSIFTGGAKVIQLLHNSLYLGGAY